MFCGLQTIWDTLSDLKMKPRFNKCIENSSIEKMNAFEGMCRKICDTFAEKSLKPSCLINTLYAMNYVIQT